MKTKNLCDNFWFTFVVFALCYAIINFLFLPHNHMISYPLQSDDYHELAFSFNLKIWQNARPVYYLFAPIFAHLGRVGFYLWMHIIVILCAVFVYRIGRKIFSFPLPIEWFIFYAVLVFSSPFIIEVSKFLGATTALYSAFFALTSMLVLIKGYRENKNLFFIFAAIFYTLSLFTKEDFILPNIILIFYLLFFDQEKMNSNSVRKKLYFFMGYSVVAIVALIIFNKYIAHNPYTGMGIVQSAYYTPSITFSNIFSVFSEYLTVNHYILVVSSIVLLVAILCIFFSEKQIKIKIMFCILFILSLIMPYSVLNHVVNLYNFNWVTWEGLVITFGLFSLTARISRKINCIFLGILSIIAIQASYPHRNMVASFYESESNINKNITDTLNYYKKQLNQESYVGVAGVMLSPWADSAYMKNKLGLKSKWIIFVDKNTRNFFTPAGHKINPDVPINVFNISQICDFTHMKLKYLYFRPDGKGKLIDDCRLIPITEKN